MEKRGQGKHNVVCLCSQRTSTSYVQQYCTNSLRPPSLKPKQRSNLLAWQRNVKDCLVFDVHLLFPCMYLSLNTNWFRTKLWKSLDVDAWVMGNCWVLLQLLHDGKLKIASLFFQAAQSKDISTVNISTFDTRMSEHMLSDQNKCWYWDNILRAHGALCHGGRLGQRPQRLPKDCKFTATASGK